MALERDFRNRGYVWVAKAQRSVSKLRMLLGWFQCGSITVDGRRPLCFPKAGLCQSCCSSPRESHLPKSALSSTMSIAWNEPWKYLFRKWANTKNQDFLLVSFFRKPSLTAYLCPKGTSSRHLWTMTPKEEKFRGHILKKLHGWWSKSSSGSILDVV